MQAVIVSIVGFGLLGLESVHSELLIVALAVANAILGMAFGLFVERVRADGVPGGAVHARLRAAADPPLRPVRRPGARWRTGCAVISYLLPVTYAFDALARAAHDPSLGARFWLDVVVVGVTFLALGLGAATLRRRTA